MNDASPQTVYLQNYRPVPYLIDEVFLKFVLAPEATQVTSRLSFRPNAAAQQKGGPLDHDEFGLNQSKLINVIDSNNLARDSREKPVSAFSHPALILDGEKLELRSVSLDGETLEPSRYDLTATNLTIREVPQRPFTLEIVTLCNPKANSELSGLYVSNNVFCTQCEAEGFRRITYFYDRPDVMARYKVRIEAPLASCPVLLANGNPGQSGTIAGGDLHFAEWEDPHPKPSYLFALVAGDLALVSDTYVTRSGRKVDLRIYVEKGKEDRCAFAMEALKTSMRWDEERFGLEYDLDIFMIVAVSDFNMGAMENKGLNIFNDKYILALPETATDIDYINIESIIAHEYFHNWTGNRVTCRDWFQLCLKEGLTVFRDQEFTADIRSRAVKRIVDVKRLRADQFPEDGGPLAHPVRPSSYIEINNFYTATVYEKGAELCRMLQTLIGREAFRKAMDLYFERHDGEAATTEDFVRCMADASGRNLDQFFTWYEQAGTPEVTVSESYDAKTKTYDLSLEQVTAPTPGQSDKRPVPIPLGIGLVGPDGRDMPLDLENVGVLNAPLIELNETKKTFRFRNVARKPVLSLNRGFSAPIRIRSNSGIPEQLFLMKNDGDTFNRWEASQRAAFALIRDRLAGKTSAADTQSFITALGAVLEDGHLDDAFKALMLGLPGEQEIATLIARDVDPGAIHQAREALRAETGMGLKDVLVELWRKTESHGAYRPDPEETGRRSLRYAVLQALAGGDPALATRLAGEQLSRITNMTDEIGALSTITTLDVPEREQALADFHTRHRGDNLLIDKWFALQASAPLSTTPGRVLELMAHPDFTLTNPNRVRSLVGAFAMANPFAFHAESGEGYVILADTILALDPKNPQVAARMATALRSWATLEEKRRGLAKAQLERILGTSGLSRDLYEIVSKSLGR
ncbi:aminopeptidase N [Nordella sp. HKS 07]|uniref:aminopeptidase N n=1 Tax=Nordella sp. HKS 07 TaxID=2712222 RepID=UPI0013E1E482|nr:aminopeptidase N [Nordella sp. HKS 07]QIG49669.1 aminopeptidase N [Nordella sp. HKS 07]